MLNESGGNTDIDISSLITDNKRAVAQDKELGSLKVGSEEFAAKVREKFGTKDSGSATETQDTSKDDKSINDKELDKDDSKIVPREQKRINKLIAEREQAKRDLETERNQRADLEKRLKDLEGNHQKSDPAKTKATVDTSTEKYGVPKPDVNTFTGTIAEYTEALAEWVADKKEFEREQKRQAETSDKQFKATITGFLERGAELEKELGLEKGDFKELLDADDLKVHKAPQEELLSIPQGHRIAFEIASDAKLKEEFSKATSNGQLRIIGKLETKFDSLDSKSKASSTKEQAQNGAVKKIIASPSPTIRGGTGSTMSDFDSIMALPKGERSIAFKAADDARRLKMGLSRNR